jgi:hypothetical protein
MKSKQFPTFEEAKEYLNSSGGEVKYHGVIGNNEYYVYTLTIGAIVWMIDIYADGRLVVTGDRNKRSDE